MTGSLDGVRFETVRLEKRYPLQISRGTSTGSNNLFVFLERGDLVGIGECAPGTGFDDTLAAEAEAKLSSTLDKTVLDRGPQAVWQVMDDAGVDRAAMAAVDTALWDLLAKEAGLPLYRLWGLSLPTVPTSVTIGINPIDVICERVPEILSRTKARCLKIKLGNSAGVEADQDSFEAAAESAKPFAVRLRVDANGGWSVSDAQKMARWLAERDCDYIEQPLPVGEEAALPELFATRPLPIFLDESVRSSSDVIAYRDRCDGINLKLMKTGGPTEALRLVATARACGLLTMIGCMGESSVAISTGASMGALFDYIDLDSHLNLAPDPAEGTQMVDGVVLPSGLPGHGAFLTC